MKFLAAAVQMACTLGDVAKNLDKASELVSRACADGASVVLLPELFSTGYRLDKEYIKYAEPVPGPTLDFMISLAKKHNAYIAGSIIEETVLRGVPFNTAVLVGPSGFIGKQPKIALWEREKLYFRAGDVAAPFDTPLGRIGLMICRDIRFGEIARALALKGAEIFLVSYAAGLIDAATQARAIDNSAYLIASNRTGEEFETRFCGNSQIIDPYGNILVDAGSDEGYVSAWVDTDTILEARRRRRYLQDYRASLFLNPSFYRQ